jgi:hypothetical protein
MSIEEHKARWCEYEHAKQDPKKALATLNKSQRVHTKAIQDYMTEQNLESLECGEGLVVTLTAAERVTFNEDVCSQYMAQAELERLKCANTRQTVQFRVVQPKRKRVRED